MKYFLFPISLFFLFATCKNEQEQDASLSQAKHVDIHNPVSVSVNDLITDIDTIRLEVTDSSLLGDIHVLHIMNDKFYILDTQNNAVFIFSRNGDFIRKIYRAGQGPQEYVRINGLEVDYRKKQFLVTDTFSKRIFIFDEYGELLQVVPLGFSPHILVARNEGFLNFYTGPRQIYHSKEMEEYTIHVLDSCGNFVSSFLENQTPLRIDIGSNQRIDYNAASEDILFQPVLSNLIYRVDKHNRVHPEYVFRNKSDYKMLTPDQRREMTYMYGEEELVIRREREGYLLSWGSVFNLDDYCFFRFGWKHPVCLYYDKKTAKSVTIDVGKIEEEGALGMLFNAYRCQTEGNYFYNVISQFKVEETAGKLPEGKLKTFLQNNNTADSNPVIIRYKIKFPQQ